MKRAKLESVVTVSRLRSLHFFMGLVFLYFLLIITQFPLLFRFLDSHHPPMRLLNEFPQHQQSRTTKFSQKILSNLVFREMKSENNTTHRAAMQAWLLGTELWAHLTRVPAPRSNETAWPACPEVVSLSGSELKSGFVGLPCGLTIGSHITVVGKPRRAHLENETRISESPGANVMVSQFMLELRREKAGGDKGPATARLLHFNPRIKGDWSGKPVIEMNNCYRGQWGAAIRCEGSRSSPSENTVDGQVKCEGWVRDDVIYSEESKADMWLDKLMGRRKNMEMQWRYPFSGDKFFVLTITAGLEGYHISVDGRHVTSFAYRTGSDLEDAMLLYVYGNVDVHSVFVAALPTFHPNVGPERHLEMSATWKARPLPHGSPTLFIGVISAGDHFAERMAVRKSWMQHHLIRSSAVVARFFVALHRKAGINKELKKEAEFFGDIVIVPYLDDYELVVLKSLAICEYGVNISAKYIMKCDDDTFVRVDAVTEEVGSADGEKSLYAGKINYYHKPLRTGKWAVTHEEWPGEVYPPYADGAGYIISLDIARFIMMEFDKGRLRLFKMEDVSMGMWVEQFNSSRPVEYLHSKHFHQSGCVDHYYTAHYQSPKQFMCLWKILQSEGQAKCCNFG